MKEMICTSIGLLGSVFAGLFGGWDMGLATLCIFMLVDYITGLVCAGVFHKSKKSETGALESRACFKGLVRKGVTLLIVLVAHRLDMVTGMNYLRDAVCIAFIVSEAISIIENYGLMGGWVPPVLLKAIDALKKRSDETDGEKKNE